MLAKIGLGLLAAFLSLSAFAQDYNFDINQFHKAQKNNEKILLHFHADWCPTCKAQTKSLATLDKEGALKGIHFFKVNYDKETEFEKEMKVTAQSTFISFYGTHETGRISGITDSKEIKGYIEKTLGAKN